MESASVTRVVFANEGDRLVGNFTVSNIPTWIDSNNSDSVIVQYAFKVSKIEGSEQCPTDIVLYEVTQTEHGSFDIFCEFTGDYRFRFNVGSGDSGGIGNMGATLKYDVIKNSTYIHPIETTPAPEGQLNQVPSTSGIETTPNVPEFSWFAILPLFAIMLYMAVKLRPRKSASLSK
jgi:hypothetical protein